ncbi:DUF2326 domain-containing protein [Bacillus wiedmannii]|uniref:DUF2326 domain-containing protein n=1 Tax=Bacillus wiedmannii TaxID=1890302 RepID=UPI000BF4BB88|nr:DUF2326 domain-containing protein [Bacillus wiedmannii]PGB70717.1 hypothetical protein COM12_04945 [Bacillus wiedmannii]
MKILNLIISNPNGEKVREIQFEKKGISVIYGKVNKPEDEKETSNSIGKTLLLKFIDYIFGANENAEMVKPKIHKWYLDAVVEYEGTKFNIKRILGKSELIVDGEKYELSEYKERFKIDRKLYNKQVFLTQKSHLISSRSDASLDDYTSLFYLLDLQNLSNKLIEYYEIQNKIKELTILEKRVIQFFDGIELSQIEEQIFLIKKAIKEKENELKLLDERITNIQISKEKSEIMDEYADKNYELKLLQVKYQKLNLEYRRLSQSLDDFNKIDISSRDIKKLYERAKFEIPELIKKRLEEVEEFQKNVYSDRKNLTEEKLKKVANSLSTKKKDINDLENEIEKLANIISQNEIYQESMAIYKEKSMELQNLMYKRGELSKIDGIIKERKDEEDKLATKYSDVKNVYTTYKEKVDKYKNFIYEMVHSIYTDKVEAYFSIQLKNRHKRNRPFAVELNLTGDTGEGVGEVRKLLIDLLILRYNKYLNVLIHDSACFSGIDNRQVSNLIKLGHKIAEETDKQYIISINDYQLNKKDEELMKLINDYTKLELDENDKLLKFGF